MNFQGLGQIQDYQYYLDVAFNAAKKIASQERQNTDANDRLNKSKDIELARVKEVSSRLQKPLKQLLESFPSLDGMTEFYQELVRNSLEYDSLKKSLGTINWGVQKIDEFAKKTNLKIKRDKQIFDINRHRREFYGRASSFMKQIGPSLLILEQARKTMKEFPSIKQKWFTVAIAGFPNVGKSTILQKLTGSKPQVKNYAFTTKSLNVASFGETAIVQCIDTPGTLNREKMNAIERLADIAMKYEADLILYVFDATLQIDAKEQIALYNKIKELDKPMLIYASKTDINPLPKEFSKYKPITDIIDLSKELLALARTYE